MSIKTFSQHQDAIAKTKATDEPKDKPKAAQATMPPKATPMAPSPKKNPSSKA